MDNPEDEARMTAGREDRDWLATLIAVQEGRFPIPLLDDAGIRESTRQARHPAWSIVDLGHERLALDVDVAHLVEDSLGRIVIRGRHDHVA